MKIDELFDLDVAKSKGNEDYDKGEIPYISSTTMNNGVLKFVEPYEDDKVFEGNKICISGLGFATVQLNKFLPKGNGGDSATILTPKEDMTIKELIYYTASFNLMHTWRFSFGRKAGKDRIKNLNLKTYADYDKLFGDEFTDYVEQFRAKINQYEQVVNG